MNILDRFKGFTHIEIILLVTLIISCILCFACIPFIDKEGKSIFISN